MINDEIYPGDTVLVYDAWANGREGYYKNQGAWREGVVIQRYGYVSEVCMRALGWSYETAQYPDVVDIQFPERVSRAHFTDGVRKVKSC